MNNNMKSIFKHNSNRKKSTNTLHLDIFKNNGRARNLKQGNKYTIVYSRVNNPTILF